MSRYEFATIVRHNLLLFVGIGLGAVKLIVHKPFRCLRGICTQERDHMSVSCVGTKGTGYKLFQSRNLNLDTQTWSWDNIVTADDDYDWVTV